jgi:hypothetical protein
MDIGTTYQNTSLLLIKALTHITSFFISHSSYDKYNDVLVLILEIETSTLSSWKICGVELSLLDKVNVLADHWLML